MQAHQLKPNTIFQMSKREKFIVGAAIIALLFAGVYYLLPGSTSKEDSLTSATNNDNTKDWIQEMEKSVAKQKLNKQQQKILDRIQSNNTWSNDIFYDRVKKSSIGQKDTPTNLAYTGYMEFQGQEYAVINGLEYTVGEKLDSGNYQIKEISPTKVVLRAKERTITVPFTSNSTNE